MHHALRIHEILSNIFCNIIIFPWILDVHLRVARCKLAALARTCRAFKDPALDILWRDLFDLSPVALCLPDATRNSGQKCQYSFIRALTQTEWDVLQNYTRRIRAVSRFDIGLDWESVSRFLDPSVTMQLLPSLHTLRSNQSIPAMNQLCLPLPSLVNLDVAINNIEEEHAIQSYLKPFLRSSPNVRKITIDVHSDGTLIPTKSFGDICCWQNLSSVVCPRVELDMDALLHLSSMSMLTELVFTLSMISPTCNMSLRFPNLRVLAIISEPLHLVSVFLSRTQLPRITCLDVSIVICPSRQELSSFLSHILTSNPGHTIERLDLDQSDNRFGIIRSEDFLLSLEDLRPCMVFNDLRCMRINIRCNVGLQDSQLITLASAWSKLEELSINDHWGWNSVGGITLGGLVKILQTSRSLWRLSLCFDTQGYTNVGAVNLSSVPSSDICMISVLDSSIKAESVPIVAAFFRCIASRPSSKHFYFADWFGTAMDLEEFPDMQKYTENWVHVSHLIDDGLTSVG